MKQLKDPVGTVYWEFAFFENDKKNPIFRSSMIEDPETFLEDVIDEYHNGNDWDETEVWLRRHGNTDWMKFDVECEIEKTFQ